MLTPDVTWTVGILKIGGCLFVPTCVILTTEKRSKNALCKNGMILEDY